MVVFLSGKPNEPLQGAIIETLTIQESHIRPSMPCTDKPHVIISQIKR